MLGIVYIPFMHSIFQTKETAVVTLLYALPFAFLIYFYDELRKYIIRRSRAGIQNPTLKKLGAVVDFLTYY